MSARPCIRAIRYAFPRRTATVRELAAAGQLKSDPELLEEFGFRNVRTSVGESPWDLARRAASDLLDAEGVEPESVGLLVYGGSTGGSAFEPAPSPATSSRIVRTTARFRSPATRLQCDLGLVDAQVMGVSELACTSMFGAIRVARALCIAEGIERALCVVTDRYPVDAGREAIFNCTSDAAVAVLVDRTGPHNRIRSFTQVTKGFYWDPDTFENEMIASYFPTARHVLERAAGEAGWDLSEVDWIVPHNVGVRSWRILASIAGLDEASIWLDNVARDAHTLAGDNFINLADALASGAVRPGHRVLLFSFGYGAHWVGLGLEA